MTTHTQSDRSFVKDLIEEAGTSSISETLADSGYDSHDVYRYYKEKNIPP